MMIMFIGMVWKLLQNKQLSHLVQRRRRWKLILATAEIAAMIALTKIAMTKATRIAAIIAPTKIAVMMMMMTC
jgi:hypothetical protein